MCLLAASFAVAKSEFSAEVVNSSRGESSTPTKIYFGKDKLRIDPSDRKGMGGSVIMNLSAHTSTVLLDDQHMYMDVPVQITNQRDPFHFFRTLDADNACSDWLAQPWNKGGTCHKVGSDTINGRNTIKYEGTNSDGESGTVWLDPKLRFPVKWQGKKGDSGELRNIQEGSQPAKLFEIPAGYTKFDMGSMMQRPQ